MFAFPLSDPCSSVCRREETTGCNLRGLPSPPRPSDTGPQVQPHPIQVMLQNRLSGMQLQGNRSSPRELLRSCRCGLQHEKHAGRRERGLCFTSPDPSRSRQLFAFRVSLPQMRQAMPKKEAARQQTGIQDILTRITHQNWTSHEVPWTNRLVL